jgi:hypothetical protein
MSKEAVMRLWTRAVVAVVLTGLAGTAQARPSVGVEGRDCGSPRLSQSKDVSYTAIQEPGGKWCVPFINDVGVVERITFESDVALDDLDVLPGSLLKKIRIHRGRKQVTLYGGYVRSRGLSIVFTGLAQPVFVKVKGYQRRALASPHP